MKVSSPSSGNLIATMDGPPEETYCSSTTSYSNPKVTITGTAQFFVREPFGVVGSSGNVGGLDYVSGTPRPVRFAEVKVKNSAGTTVQCATTTNTGTFSFEVPQDGSSYTIFVNSRGDNSTVKASVLTSPEFNTHYSITASFVADGSKTVNPTTAPADGTVLGGAFNIFDQIVKTNEYLKTEAGTCVYSGCNQFSVAPKVRAYWRKGVNPGAYLNSSSALSYYLPGYSRLFILGGLNGDVDNTDTDHFDNSIIIHEYGHFLEDVMSESNSPGGSHNGNKIIDPRLAWSEGWGNFIQAAVRGDAQYIDTMGNRNGTTRFYFKTNLETASSGSDEPDENGEGIFREFAVTRFLWDVVDPTGEILADDISGGFADIWAIFTKGVQGMLQTSLAFRNIGDFHKFQIDLKTNNGGRDLASLRTLNAMDVTGSPAGSNATREYAQYVTTGSTCTYAMSPLGEVDCGGAYQPTCGSFSASNWLRNNDFFHLKISSSGSYTLRLEYTDADATAPLSDADLYLYNKNARYGVTADIVGKSELETSGTAATTQVETFTATLSPGDYLINVRVYTGSGGQAVGSPFNYTLTLNGNQLCPSSLP